ncbi:sensor histidine kinase [Lacrimispora sp.]|uniref:sensor histidine kinase n=1 Tax=Lacrimispora sp. TaxID=2719234 RepID=UPI0028B1A8D1|nr:HAMP domain-containing sensor histidine kinase [Lacrimispora sp.]
MHKISLRLRITLLVGLLLVLLTTMLTIVSILSANYYFVTPQLQEGAYEKLNKVILDSTPIDSTLIDSNHDMNTDTLNNLSAQTKITAAQRGFSLQSVTVLIAIIIFGLGVTYWIMGRALRPLTVLSETIHDINEHNLSKPIEESIAKDEVGSITASFNSMLDRLKNSFEQQKSFSASAAHELKTPLATMKTSLQVLRLDDLPSADDFKDTILVMEQNVDRLICIVSDLLLLSSQGKTELDDEISLRTLFCEIAEELKEAIQRKNLCCILPQNDCLITGNRMLLRSAFYNLFENAVKYNKDGGTVEAKLQNTLDGKISVLICDTGIGMTEEDAVRAFEPFFRAEHSRLQQIPGNGLGMPIIQTIIERHGGEILLESKINIGTKVIVVL